MLALSVNPRPATVVLAAGDIARRALIACGGVTRPVPGFTATSFRLAGTEIIWVGQSAPLHPRVALVEGDRPQDLLDAKSAICYQPQTVGGQGFSSIDCLKPLTRAILGLLKYAKPGGFGGLLAAQPLEFPLSHRRDAACALARACADSDANAFISAASRLLGVGGGLTPSGDDFVGGALFARRFISGGSAASLRWQAGAIEILASATMRTHAISYALLSDLARGESYAPLHALSNALLQGDADATHSAMRDLVAIGHSSGWDMLAGFIAGATGKTQLIGQAQLIGQVQLIGHNQLS